MRPRWHPDSSPLRSTPGRTRTRAGPDVNRVPLPLGHGSNFSSPGWIRTSVLHRVEVASTPLLHETIDESVRRGSHPPVHPGKVVPVLLGHGHESKDGRSRTLCVRVGAALLSREHVPVDRTARTGIEPVWASALTRLTGVRNYQ
jgi:hypothetical protein